VHELIPYVLFKTQCRQALAWYHSLGLGQVVEIIDNVHARRLFAGLSGGGGSGGRVMVPYAKQAWGACFGMVRDRFGVQWMVHCKVG